MRALICIVLLSAATAATAQSRANEPVKPPVFFEPFRAIPKEAVHGTIRHLHEMLVEIDGEQRLLTPGAQIRDARNNLILPIGLPDAKAERAHAKYQRDGTGRIHRVWLLSEREIAALPPPPYPK